MVPKPKRKPKATYYLRQSKTKKHNKDKHVRKYKPKKTYSNTITYFACNELNHLFSACPNRKNLYIKEAKLVGCTNLDLVEVKFDVSDTSSIYSIIYVEDMEEIPSSDYTLVNSFLNNPYGLAKKYDISSPFFQKDLDDLEEQLDQLYSKNFNLMFSQFFP